MKLLLIIVTIVFACCTPEVINISEETLQEVKKENPAGYDWLAIQNPFYWCNSKIVCYGDSYTESPGAWPYTGFLANFIYGQEATVKNYDWPFRGFYVNSEVVAYNSGVSGQSSTEIKNRMIADTAHRSWCTVIWAGTNNSWDTAQISKDIEQMISALPHKKYIVVGMLVPSFETSLKGTLHYTVITQYNDRMKQKYGKHFVDAMPDLLSHANDTPKDKFNVKYGVVPNSLRIDEVHLNTAGYYIVAEAIYNNLVKCF